MSSRSVHLLFAANRWECVNTIKEKLAAGITLVCDRYAYSGVVYTIAQEEQDGNKDVEWCATADVGLPEPDLILFLDLPIHKAAARPGYGKEVYENEAFQTRIRELFLEYKTDQLWISVNADLAIDELTVVVLTLVKNIMACSDKLHQPVRAMARLR